MTALVGGLAALVLGIIGLVIWFELFLKALMAGVPIMLILGGALATYLGIEEMKDKKASENFESNREEELKREVESLKEEVETLKKDTEETETEEEKPAS
ncbi:MAG: hypothetical protein R6V25_00780 [Desulfatiglandales bacterium]